MPLEHARRSTQAMTDTRLTKAVNALVRHLDLPLPDLPEPIRGVHPGVARVERELAVAVRIEAAVECLRHPLSD